MARAATGSRAFAIADDHEDADGTNVLNFWQASDKAKALARGSDADAGRPATVGEALTDYADRSERSRRRCDQR